MVSAPKTPSNSSARRTDAPVSDGRCSSGMSCIGHAVSLGSGGGIVSVRPSASPGVGHDDVTGDRSHVGIEAARTAPTASAARRAGRRRTARTDAGAMPAKVSERVRATVTAGLAKLVEDVKK